MGMSDPGRCIMHIVGLHDAHGGWWGYIVRAYSPAHWTNTITPYTFQCQVGIFANVRNTKCKKFFSDQWSRHSQGTNAFAHRWRERAWMNPPWHLAHQALRKLDRERCTALTLLPYWPRAPCWPILLELQISPMTHLTGQLYTAPKGDPLPPPHWRTVCLVTQGRGMPAAPYETYSCSPTSPPCSASA